MHPDDTTVPEDDAIATSARRALDALAATAPAGDRSWAHVQLGARHIQRRRVAAAGTACAIVLATAGVAVAATGRGGSSHLRVAAGDSTLPPTTLAPTSSAVTTSTPGVDNSSSAPPRTDPTTGVGGTAGPSTTLGTLPADAPQAGDVTGTITVASHELHAMQVSDSIVITTTITNTSDHNIWTSSAQAPTAYATVCSTDSADPSHTLWWMTSISLAPGATDTRSATFTPTHAYVGKVDCELDLVWSNQQGDSFDTSAGGDAAQTYVIGRVPGVPLVTFAVYAPPGGDASTTLPDRATITLAPTTTVPR